MRPEKKDELEIAADQLLADDTAKRGSGLTVRSPRPTAETLTGDLAVYGCHGATWDSYPSDTEGDCAYDSNLHSRFLEGLIAAKLTDRQRACLQLVVIQGQSYRIAGQELDLAPGTVQSHVTTALDKLRAALNKSDIAALLFPALLG
jgi:DNA-binding CsgD family transcriptional regulator